MQLTRAKFNSKKHLIEKNFYFYAFLWKIVNCDKNVLTRTF